MSGDIEGGAKTLRSLKRRRLKLQMQRLDLADGREGANDEAKSDDSSEQKPPTADEIKKQIDSLKPIIARAAAAAATKRKDLNVLRTQLKTAKLNSLIQAQWLADAGDIPAGIKLAEAAVNSVRGTGSRSLAVLVDLLWRKGDKAAATKRFEALRKLAGVADIDTPMLAKLKPVAKELKIEGDWRIPPKLVDALAQRHRPPLDDLGPFRWQPYVAPSWDATLADGEVVSNAKFDGRPRLVIFDLVLAVCIASSNCMRLPPSWMNSVNWVSTLSPSAPKTSKSSMRGSKLSISRW